MKYIKTILVDDEPRGLATQKKLLEINCPEVEVIACCANADEAKKQILALNPQLVFLDIAMPGKNGLELLNEFEEINFEIIFITAFNNYMTQAFHFSAVDYLLKPVDDDLLIQAVKRAGQRIFRSLQEDLTDNRNIKTFLSNIHNRNNGQKMKLCIPSLKGFQVVEIQDIIYCEASSNYTNFNFTNRSSLCASKPIHEYEELLKDSHFVRIHKSYLINIEHIKEYVRGEGGSIMLSNGNELDVSRRKKDLLMTRMKDYFKF